MRILVTGSRGQLVRSLAERSAGDPDLTLLTAGRPDVDFAEPGSIGAMILAARPDVVVNAAAYTAVDQAEDEPELAQRINAEAAGEVAAAAHAVGAPVIHVSTDYVFDGTARAPLTERNPVAPIGVYGRTKLEGEEAVRAAAPAHAIVRTAWLVSPFGRNFLTTMLGAAATRDELRVVADQVGSPTNALDLADALLVLAREIAAGKTEVTGRTFHVAGSGEASWYDVAAFLMDEARRHGLPAARVVPIRTADWPTRATRPAYSVLDSRAFAAATGFVMPDWRASLARVVARLAEEAS